MSSKNLGFSGILRSHTYIDTIMSIMTQQVNNQNQFKVADKPYETRVQEIKTGLAALKEGNVAGQKLNGRLVATAELSREANIQAKKSELVNELANECKNLSTAIKDTTSCRDFLTSTKVNNDASYQALSSALGGTLNSTKDAVIFGNLTLEIYQTGTPLENQLRISGKLSDLEANYNTIFNKLQANLETGTAKIDNMDIKLPVAPENAVRAIQYDVGSKSTIAIDQQPVINIFNYINDGSKAENQYEQLLARNSNSQVVVQGSVMAVSVPAVKSSSKSSDPELASTDEQIISKVRNIANDQSYAAQFNKIFTGQNDLTLSASAFQNIELDHILRLLQEKQKNAIILQEILQEILQGNNMSEINKEMLKTVLNNYLSDPKKTDSGIIIALSLVKECKFEDNEISVLLEKARNAFKAEEPEIGNNI